MKRFLIFAAVLTLVSPTFLIGCGGSQAVNVQRIDSETRQGGKSEKLNDLLLKSAMAANVDHNADYVIGADDLLDIDVFQAEELHRTVRVSSQGYIGLPLVGQIKAKGLTTVHLEQGISQKLEKFLQEPRVSVIVKEYKAQKIGVIGAVTNPQVYMVTGQRYLLDMLTIAGGLNKDAGNICYILRPVDSGRPGTTKTETIVVNLDELLEKGDLSLNIPVFGGDVINVAKAGIIFIDGPVNRPGAFPFKARMTLREAIITAGGLRYEADPSDVKILRDKGDGTREIMSLNYEDICDGKSGDVLIKENDIIVVATSGFKNFLTGFFGFFKGGYSAGSVVVGH